MGKTPILLGLIFPALMILTGYWAYNDAYLDEFWLLYSAFTPALVSVLGWGAVTLNEVALKRGRKRSDLRK